MVSSMSTVCGERLHRPCAERLSAQDGEPCCRGSNAFLLLQGLETVAVRVERHVYTPAASRNSCATIPRVAWVHYAGFPGNPYYELAQKYLNGRPRLCSPSG